jgi:hypothetical protein
MALKLVRRQEVKNFIYTEVVIINNVYRYNQAFFEEKEGSDSHGQRAYFTGVFQ